MRPERRTPTARNRCGASRTPPYAWRGRDRLDGAELADDSDRLVGQVLQEPGQTGAMLLIPAWLRQASRNRGGTPCPASLGPRSALACPRGGRETELFHVREPVHAQPVLDDLTLRDAVDNDHR